MSFRMVGESCRQRRARAPTASLWPPWAAVYRWKIRLCNLARHIELLETRRLLSNDIQLPEDHAVQPGLPVIALIDTSLPDQQLLLASLPDAATILFDSQTES